MPRSLPLPEGARTVRLPFEVASVTAARRLLLQALRVEGASVRTIEDVNVIVGELVMNGIRHGRPGPGNDLELAWWFAAGTLGVSVHDAGHVTRLSATMPGVGAEGGRGLAMVAIVADAWAYDNTDGTRVVAELQVS